MKRPIRCLRLVQVGLFFLLPDFYTVYVMGDFVRPPDNLGKGKERSVAPPSAEVK